MAAPCGFSIWTEKLYDGQPCFALTAPGRCASMRLWAAKKTSLKPSRPSGTKALKNGFPDGHQAPPGPGRPVRGLPGRGPSGPGRSPQGERLRAALHPPARLLGGRETGRQSPSSSPRPPRAKRSATTSPSWTPSSRTPRPGRSTSSRPRPWPTTSGPSSTRRSSELPEEIRIFTYDGDTPQDARQAIRARGHIVLTNPDMLHAGILPHHTKWIKLFENLNTSSSTSCTTTGASSAATWPTSSAG